MSDCRKDKPSSGKKYSTSRITVTIDGEEKYMSPHYRFPHQGYYIMYDVTNSMNDCVDEKPQDNIEYSTNRITVTIDGEVKQMSLYYAFADYAYTTMYDVNDSMNACIDSNPQDGGKYSTDTISVTINGEEKTLSSHYTFAEQGYDGTLYGKGDCDSEYYELDPSIAYPQEYTRYLTESKITVTIDNEDVELFTHLTFAEQGYPEAYKEVNGEDIECGNDYPVEGEEYWTT